MDSSDHERVGVRLLPRAKRQKAGGGPVRIVSMRRLRQSGGEAPLPCLADGLEQGQSLELHTEQDCLNDTVIFD